MMFFIGLFLSAVVIMDGLVTPSSGNREKTLSMDYHSNSRSRALMETLLLNFNSQRLRRIPPGQLRPCPLCEGWYSYCSEFLFHDACCCSDPKHVSWACKSVNCGFLNAFNCEEHFMITDCCCSD